MKKIFTTILTLTALVFAGFAQNDTLLFENFQGPTYDNFLVGFPTEDNLSPDWVNYDLDGLADQSGADRPDEWFLALAFADADTNYMPLTYSDSDNVVLASNSWTNDAATFVSNFMVTPKIFISDDQAVLRWKSAPFQTPRYLDGYYVMVSTAGNEDYEFTDTLMHFAEFLSASNLDDTLTYVFSSGVRHSMIEDNDGDILRYTGVLQESEVSLAAYAGMSIHIAFWHGTHDDNLISIDDVLVLGNGNVGIEENKESNIGLSFNPNPVVDQMQVNYYLKNNAQITSSVYDISGKLISSKARGFQLKGNHQFSYNVSELAAGSYFLTLDTGKEKISEKFVVTK